MLDPAAFAGRCFLCLPFAGMKAKKMSPLCGIRRTINDSDTYLQISQRNREYGSLVVYLCVIPRLSPVLLKVGGECIPHS